MRTKSSVGQIGEDVAVEYLSFIGHKVLYRNKRFSFGELDIVSRDKFGTLVFVEVKTLWGSGADLRPEQNYTFEKDRKTKKSAQYFANKFPEYIDENLGYRVDLVTVLIKNPELRDWRKDCDVKHYENL